MMHSIRDFRKYLADQIDQECKSGQRRNIIVLAVDGIDYTHAQSAWPDVTLEQAVSVFPSTSSTAWLSALTGASVDDHGIPGVVFRMGPREMVNIFEYQGALNAPQLATIFTDATDLGYAACAVLGDWEDYPGPWRNMLLNGASLVRGHRFYTHTGKVTASGIVGQVEHAIGHALDGPIGGNLIWCFVDIDRHIHKHGYDEHVRDVLAGLDGLARRWVQTGHCVIAHSDHGLVETSDHSEYGAQIDALMKRHNVEMGGAGRVRWLYADGDRPLIENLMGELQTIFGADAIVSEKDTFFRKGSPAYQRVGDVVIVAQGTDFLCDTEYTFEHGSWTQAEREAMLATWHSTDLASVGA
ncbi:MAG: hypothetical protein WA790_19965 [Sulfitobacter sp.]